MTGLEDRRALAQVVETAHTQPVRGWTRPVRLPASACARCNAGRLVVARSKPTGGPTLFARCPRTR
jgi:hypothetical protein